MLDILNTLILTILQTRFSHRVFVSYWQSQRWQTYHRTSMTYFNVFWADSNSIIQFWRQSPLHAKTQKDCSSHFPPQVYLTILKTSLWSEYFPFSTQTNPNHLRKLCKKSITGNHSYLVHSVVFNKCFMLESLLKLPLPSDPLPWSGLALLEFFHCNQQPTCCFF